MSLSDIPEGGILELAGYLRGFPPHDEDAEQYWYLLACELRKRNTTNYNYSQNFLVTVGQHSGQASLVFLNDLKRRNIPLEELIQCLEIIKCQKAINFFKHGATTPIITEIPDFQPLRIYHVGERLCLSVAAKCDPGPIKYCWFCDRKPIVPSDSHQLIIDTLTTGHKGSYCCRATNPFINNPNKACTFSRPVQIEVYENHQANGIIRQETRIIPPAPIIQKHPTSVEVRRGEGRAVSFECVAKEGVVYDWYKDGELKVKNCSEGNLVLDRVKLEDQGEYYCKVSNDGGEEQSNLARLTFIGDIDITGQPRAQSIFIKDPFKLQCSARSRKAERELRYEWFKVDRGELVSPSVKVGPTLSKRVSHEDLTSRRKFTFCCKVVDVLDSSNFRESDHATVTVNTVRITEEPQGIQAQIHQKSELTCTGEGEGKLQYRWFHSPTEKGQYKISNGPPLLTGTLVFKRLLQSHSGYYYCQISNKWEHVHSKKVQVKCYLPRDRQAPPPSASMKVIWQPRSRVVPEGEPFRMVFEVVCSNRKPIQYQWYFRGTKLEEETKGTLERYHATMEDYGSYWCAARAAGSSIEAISDAVRVELPFKDTEEPLSANWEQRSAEKILKIESGDSYAIEKIALLIGNQSYQHSNPLHTPENDIRALGAVLKEPPFNFKVFSYSDLTHDEMQRALEMFYNLLHVPGTYALFYFSGHGFSSNPQNNFIVPVDSKANISECFRVHEISKDVQEKFSRAFMILDACQIVHDQITDMEYLINPPNLSSRVEIWSCTPNTTASDGEVSRDGKVSSRSSFNVAFTDAIKEKMTMHDVFEVVLRKIRDSSVQRPSYTGAFADNKITLHDPIMIDGMDPCKEKKLDANSAQYQIAIGVPEPYIFKGAEMKDLNAFAELHLSFSSVLANVVEINAGLYLLHADKTASATIEFDLEFLKSQNVQPSAQLDPHLDGQDEGLCAMAELTVRSLQRLENPLTVVMTVCLMESGHERKTVLTYDFQQPPPLLMANEP